VQAGIVTEHGGRRRKKRRQGVQKARGWEGKKGGVSGRGSVRVWGRCGKESGKIELGEKGCLGGVKARNDKKDRWGTGGYVERTGKKRRQILIRAHGG